VKEYENRQNEWKLPLLKKKEKREKRLEKEAEKGPAVAQEAVVYVHNAENGVTLPHHPENVFAVIRLLGIQHKVSKNDRVMVEQLPYEVGTQICLNDILLVGTTDYTAIGRPLV